MNVLVLSCGTRNKIIQYLKKELNGKGKVVATDCSHIAPALYEADCYYIVPRISEPGYIERILEICEKEKIKGVFSLIDPELSLIAKEKERFDKLGVMLINSPYELCELTLDKWQMFCWLKEKGYLCANSYLNVEDFMKAKNQGHDRFPVFVKPVRGSASIAISKVNDEETLRLLCNQSEDLMIQEYLDGQEIGVDCYIDMLSHEVISIFAKKKLVMRAGETDKAVSFKDEKLFELVKKFVKEAGFVGQIDIDIFEKDGQYYISEVNPRFGGGYPHAYESGANHMDYIIRNLNGLPNQPDIGNYRTDVYMMKYNEVCIKSF